MNIPEPAEYVCMILLAAHLARTTEPRPYMATLDRACSEAAKQTGEIWARVMGNRNLGAEMNFGDKRLLLDGQGSTP